MKQLIKQISSKLKTQSIDFNKKVMIALSGGADSVFLTEIISKIFPLENILCVHINHNLRDTSADDEKFVADFCAQKKIKVIIESIDVKKTARESKKSVETAARELRYSIFEKLIAKYNIDYLMTAHTADDNIETFCMRLFRGVGLKGLQCIQYLTIKNNYALIRPLLNIKKTLILDALENNKIKFVVDETNFQPIYFRNKIRLELLPYIKNNFAVNIDDNILNLVELININNKFNESEILKIIENKKIINFVKNDLFKIHKKKYSKLEKYCRLEIIRYALNRLVYKNQNFHLYAFEAKHIYYLDDFIINGVSGHHIDLSFNIKAIIEFDFVNVCLNADKNETIDIPEKKISVDLNKLPLDFCFADKNIKIDYCDFEFYKNNNDSTSAFFVGINDIPEKFVLTFRKLKNADKIHLPKRGCSKTVKQLFQEKKIGITKRNKYFGVFNNEKLLIIPQLAKTFDLLTETTLEKNEKCLSITFY